MKKTYPAYYIFIGLAIILFVIAGIGIMDQITGTDTSSGPLPVWVPPLISGGAMLAMAFIQKKKRDKAKEKNPE